MDLQSEGVLQGRGACTERLTSSDAFPRRVLGTAFCASSSSRSDIGYEELGLVTKGLWQAHTWQSSRVSSSSSSCEFQSPAAGCSSAISGAQARASASARPARAENVYTERLTERHPVLDLLASLLVHDLREIAQVLVLLRLPSSLLCLLRC